MFSAKAESWEGHLEWKNKKVYVNGVARSATLKELGNRRFELELDGQYQEVDLLDYQPESKQFIFRIANQKVRVQLREPMDDLLDRMGMNQGHKTKNNDIKAPMPGMVLKILVHAGQEIKKGEPLLILEAMKMENVIKSPTDGVVEIIKVEEKEKVEKNALLLQLK